MRAITVLALATALMSSPAVAASDADVLASVKTLASAMTDGYATFSPADVTIVKAPDSGRVAALFLLVGFGKGNGSSQYVAFFEPNEPFPGERIDAPAYRLLALSQIGSKGWRYFNHDTAYFSSGSLTISGHSYSPKDALCCPTQPFTVVLRVLNGRITEDPGGG